MKLPPRGLLLLLVVLCVPVACGRAGTPVGRAGTPVGESPAADVTAGATADGFDRRAMLENIVNELVLPAHAALATRLAELETATRAFVAAPGPETLAAAQDAWLAANLARMAVLPYRMAPVDDSLLHNRLDNRPPRTPFIDDEILAGTMAITPEYIESIGSSSVGLGAMEYLLFDPAGGDPAVLARFTTGDGTARRGELLTALAAAMPPKAEALRRIWAADGDDYARAFIEADMDGGDLQGSFNMLANQMIGDVEEIVASRLGKPLGKRTNGEIRPDLVEAAYSGASLPRIIATLEAERATFTGGDGPGLDDYLDFLGAMYGEEPLSRVIVAQFDAALAALRAIDEPLETAVRNDPAGVEAAYEEVRALLALLKADMVNHLGLTLTFNDNDGD